MWSALLPIKLNDLITAGPVERGLYVLPRSSQTVPTVSQYLVGLFDNESIPNGEKEAREQSKLIYSPYRYWRRNSRIGQIIWLDSGHLFDASFVSREAKNRKLDPLRVLRAIKVERPFSASQLGQMLDHVPNPALLAPQTEPSSPSPRGNVKELRNSQAIWWTPLVIISDLIGLFWNSPVSSDVHIHAFRSFLIRLAYLRQRAIVLVFLDNENLPAECQHLLAEVLRMSRRVMHEVDAVATSKLVVRA